MLVLVYNFALALTQDHYLESYLIKSKVRTEIYNNFKDKKWSYSCGPSN